MLAWAALPRTTCPQTVSVRSDRVQPVLKHLGAHRGERPAEFQPNAAHGLSLGEHYPEEFDFLFGPRSGKQAAHGRRLYAR